MADAAREHRHKVDHAFLALTQAITSNAEATNATFPFYQLPFYEHYVQNFMDQGGIELGSVGVRVVQEKVGDWLHYATDTHEQWVREGHMFQHGKLDHFVGGGYKPYITRTVPGTGFVPDITREEYWVHWTMFPSPFTYNLINWNFASVDDYYNIVEAMKIIKNETLATRVRSYAALVGNGFTKEYHDSLHGVIPEGETEYPHSIHFHAIQSKMNDPNAEVVGFVAGGVAWVSRLFRSIACLLQFFHAS